MRRVSVRPKSHPRDEYTVFCSLLRELREDAGPRQAELLRVSQNYVSAYEMGKVRLDFVQIRDWCAACGSTFAHLLARFEQVWALPEAAQLERARQRAANQAAAWSAWEAALAASDPGSVREGLPADGGAAPVRQRASSEGGPAGSKPRAVTASGSSSASAQQVSGADDIQRYVADAFTQPYRDLIALVVEKANPIGRRVPIVFQGYDYPRVSARVARFAEQLGGGSRALVDSVGRAFIDAFDAVLSDLAAEHRGTVYLADLRGTLTGAADWADEIHASTEGSRGWLRRSTVSYVRLLSPRGNRCPPAETHRPRTDSAAKRPPFGGRRRGESRCRTSVPHGHRCLRHQRSESPDELLSQSSSGAKMVATGSPWSPGPT